MDKMKVLDRLISHCNKKSLHINTYPGVSEKGYEDTPMVCANWNKDKLKRILKWGEDYFFGQVSFSWSDEWTECSDCYKAVRVVPDSYGWTTSYLWANDCEIVCHNHYENYKEDIIEYYKNSTNRAVHSDFYPILEKEGFICYSPDEYCQRFETGFHIGQNDDPKKVAKDIRINLPGYDFVFKIDSVGQFDCHWSVYLRKGE